MENKRKNQLDVEDDVNESTELLKAAQANGAN